MDAGRDAGTVDMDGGDAATPDGGEDSAVPPVDAGIPTCTAAPEDRHLLSTDNTGSDRIVGLAAGGSAFAMLWNETRVGQPDIFGRTLSPSAGLGDERRITDHFARENTPSIVASGTDWIAAWVDNDGTTGFEVRTQLLDASLGLSGGVHPVTATMGILEDNPTLGRTASGTFLAWVEDDMIGGTRIARAQALGADGSPSGSVQAASEGSTPGQLALGELADGPVLLWSEGIGTMQDLMLQPLTSTGARRGSPSTVSTESNADGTVDAALGPSGGAVVFGVLVSGIRSEVRFRPIGEDGTLLGAERALTSPPVIGRGPSIAAFAGGYVVAYRRTDTAEPTIELMLLSAFGDPVSDTLSLGAAAAAGGRVTVRVSGEGQIAVAWADNRGATTDIIVALVRCGG